MSTSFKLTALFLSMILWVNLAFSAEQPVTDCSNIETLQSKYFTNNQYNEFIDALNKFDDKSQTNPLCLNYYRALGRYQQLKYLEQKQLWDDYFANGNTYRDQLVENANKVIDQAQNSNALKLKTRLLLWQFHQDQQDALAQQALDDLITDSKVYAEQTNDPELLKEVADKLMSYEEKIKAREIYKLYVDQLLSNQIDAPQLKTLAAGFYKEGNLELAQTVYGLYIEKISKSFTPEEFTKELFEIGSLFVYKPTGLYDMAYAEQVYEKIEGLGQKDAFSQETIYLRAFNLEKYRDYKKANEIYLQLIQIYPDTKYYDEAVYKIGMINVYALADTGEARKYFDILTAKTVFSPQVISSFYQLGLLAQWEGDLVKAKEYYERLLKNAGDNYPSIIAQAKNRLNEIQENKQLDYNLMTFLDLSLKKENILAEMGKAELEVSSYVLSKEQKFNISTTVNMPQSGCNQVDLQYLWSGNLGGATPEVTKNNFQGTYADAGTKEINLIIVLPTGPVDRYFTMVDVY